VSLTAERHARRAPNGTDGEETLTIRRLALAILVAQLAFLSARALGAQEPMPPPPPAPQAADTGTAGNGDFTPDHPPQPPPILSGDAGGGTGEGGETGAPDGPALFHDSLAPYGRWLESAEYGAVWAPSVAPSWRPYTAGRWVDTDQGWGWVGDEPWGWAPFHYGRWYYDRQIGWAWVPGTVWAPAWVAWRQGGGYLGWAPLPPAVGFSADAGLDFGGVVITPGFYTFVAEKDLLAPRAGAVIVPTGRNAAIAFGTANVTSYRVVNNRIFNGGVSEERIRQVTGRPVPRFAVAAMRGANGRRGAFYQPQGLASAVWPTRREFGKALPKQVAAQRASRAAAGRLRGSDSRLLAAGQRGAGVAPAGSPRAASQRPGQGTGPGTQPPRAQLPPAPPRQSQPGAQAPPAGTKPQQSANAQHQHKPPL
jgi:hypothetical protein